MIAGPVFGRFDDADIGALLSSVRGVETLDATSPRRIGISLADPGTSLSHPGDSLADPDDVFAAALWSCLVEPGDAVGGVLRSLLGPADALALLLRPDAVIEARLREAGVVDVDRIDLPAARARWAPRHSEARFRAAFAAAARVKARLVVPSDADWPVGLDELGIHGAACLWVRGDMASVMVNPSVAIVGCRAATSYGEQVAAELAHGLATRGVTLVSGGAYGIDGMAHRSALASGGPTVAVLAGGVDNFYPAANHDLLARIAVEGAVVSENPCGTPPTKWRFLQRNRLLAAMSAATVVVEAGSRSGALNTATHAQALERPLGAVPGPITSRASDGCHRLLRDGAAVCITGVDDVLALNAPVLVPLPPTEAGRGRGRESGASLAGPAGRSASAERPLPDEVRLLDALSRRSPKPDSQLALESGLSESRVRGLLAVLELSSRAEERPSGWVMT